MKNTSFVVAAVLAFLLAAGMILRMRAKESAFQRTVRESLETSEGYDQRFIDLVNRLEEVLATRASFGYTGGKDPMTGRTRQVVVHAPRKPRALGAPGKRDEDPVRLTAIIADQAGKHTAIIMDGERSLAVDVGDVVRNLRVTRITQESVSLLGDSLYIYGISGAREVRSVQE